MHTIERDRARTVRGLAERLSALPLRWQIGTLVVLGLIGVFTLFGLLGAAIASVAKERTVCGWLEITRSAAASIDSELAEQYERLDVMASRVGPVGDIAQQRDILTGALWNDGSLVSAGSAPLSRPVIRKSTRSLTLRVPMSGFPGIRPVPSRMASKSPTNR